MSYFEIDMMADGDDGFVDELSPQRKEYWRESLSKYDGTILDGEETPPEEVESMEEIDHLYMDEQLYLQSIFDF